MPLLGGLLFDRIGVRIGTIVFTMINCAGNFLFMLGGYQKDFQLLFAGRVLIGLGSECMYVGQMIIITSWFKYHEMSLAMAISSLIALCGSFAAGWYVPLEFNKEEDFGTAF